MRNSLLILIPMLLIIGGVSAQDATVDEIVQGVYARDSAKRAAVSDLTMTAESYSRKLSGDGEVKEEKKFLKTYYFKPPQFKVEFHEYVLDGETQDKEKLREQIKEAKERREKGRTRDAAIEPLTMFHPDARGNYDFELIGVEDKEGVNCYHITADCRLEEDTLFEGDFWFTTDGFNPVHAEFHPAKMPSKIKQLDMKRTYKEAVDGWWLPEYFYLRGRGKVLIFIKFNFEVEEYYADYEINSGLDDSFFKEIEDED